MKPVSNLPQALYIDDIAQEAEIILNQFLGNVIQQPLQWFLRHPAKRNLSFFPYFWKSLSEYGGKHYGVVKADIRFFF